MFDRILEILDGITSGERAFNDLVGRWAIDRWFTFPAMRRSCEYSVSRMAEHGLAQARVELFPADGRTVIGSWQMPLAWDASGATLEVVEPQGQAGRLLCNYQAVPCCLTMWSRPTPPVGETAELVVVPECAGEADFAGVEVTGKIVFTSLRGMSVRNEAVHRGAVGVLSDHSRHPLEMPDAVDWMNAWSEDPDGWGLKAGERTIWGFNISHRQGQELRRWLASGRVVLRARVATRLYEGEMPVATGVVPGRGEEEVLVVGHGAEQGANDNASGCAVMVEALRALRLAIGLGKLQRPARSIRALVSWEIYGTQAFYAAHTERFSRTVAGLCLDMVGENQSVTKGYTTIHRNPHAMLSFTDALGTALARRVFGPDHVPYRWNTAEFAMTDNITADPTIGVPTPWIGADGTSDPFWHTSEDTPDKVSTANLKMMATYTATYLYFLASAGLDEARYLAELMAADARSEIQVQIAGGVGAIIGASSAQAAMAAGASATRRIGYLTEIHTRAFDTLERLVTPTERKALGRIVARHRDGLSRCGEEHIRGLDATLAELGAARGWRLPPEEARPGTPEDHEAAGMIVSRRSFGSLCLDAIPPGERRGIRVNRFGGPLHTLLSWCNGVRTLADAARLARSETGDVLEGYVAQVRILEELGMVRIERGR